MFVYFLIFMFSLLLLGSRYGHLIKGYGNNL